MHFAQILDNKVINIIVADSFEIAQAVSPYIVVEVDTNLAIGVGWDFDGTNFIQPEPVIEEDDTKTL